MSFELTIDQVVDEAYKTSKEKGWHPTPDHTFPERIALMHSELSEALEEFRNGHGVSEVYYGPDGKPEGVPIELADAIIRIADCCGSHGVDLESA